MRTLTAAKWRRVSSSQILVQLSVVSHNTQKRVVRQKLCRFSSKPSPEMLSFVSYASSKVFVEKEDKTGVFHCEDSRLTGTLTYVC